MRLRRKVRLLGSKLLGLWLRRRFSRATHDATTRTGPRGRKSSDTLTLGIGPSNTAGLPNLWANALHAERPEITVETFGRTRSGVVDFPCDRPISLAEWKSPIWQLGQARRVLMTYTHLLVESGSSVLGTLYGRFFDDELGILEAAGVKVALVFHGSELRDPDQHAQLEPFSPFRDAAKSDPGWYEKVQRLKEMSSEIKFRVQQASHLPVFVTTPGLQDYLPQAKWFPAVVEAKPWRRAGDPRQRPVVLHIPTNPGLKGSQLVDRTCFAMHDQGIIEYLRPSLVPSKEVPDLLHRADILVDSLLLGDDGPSVSACEALALGLTVVGHLAERVRSRIPGEVPVVEATPLTLAEVLTSLVQDPSRREELTLEGQEYVQRFHSGSYSVDALAAFIG